MQASPWVKETLYDSFNLNAVVAYGIKSLCSHDGASSRIRGKGVSKTGPSIRCDRLTALTESGGPGPLGGLKTVAWRA